MFLSLVGQNRHVSLPVMFEQFEKYIKENYSGAKKIVEVGVGHRIDVAIGVKMRLPGAEVIVTDKDESWIRSRRTRKVKAVVDDITHPRLSIYEGAGLVYSLHPPVELVPSLVSLARKIRADLLVVPVMDEQEAFQERNWTKVAREGRTVGWLMAYKESRVLCE